MENKGNPKKAKKQKGELILGKNSPALSLVSAGRPRPTWVIGASQSKARTRPKRKPPCAAVFPRVPVETSEFSVFPVVFFSFFLFVHPFCVLLLLAGQMKARKSRNLRESLNQGANKVDSHT